MLIDFNFRHFQPSDELIEFVAQRFHRVAKLDKKSVRAQVVFSYQKATKRVDVTVRGANLDLHAHAESDDYFTCIELVAQKLERQLEKSRGRAKGTRRNVG
jgi:ribosomal subunit interface protein